MRRYPLPIVFVLLVAIACGGCGSRPVISGPAPDFTLQGLDGNTVTLSDLKGQVVVLDFWASWCDPCVEGLDHLQQVHDGYGHRGVAVLALNVDEGREEVVEFVADHGYSLRMLLDKGGSVTDAYGVQALPHTVIVDQAGEIDSIPLGSEDVLESVRRLLSE
jgi:cytochrome c biogenesis protein CcmG/thiol:disulfide interchange protein DsbE